MMLILSGSFGYTLIRHNCLHCGADEIIATVSGSPDEAGCCCGHDAVALHHHHSTGECAISDDCCSHEAERVVTADLVRSEVQNEIMPYFLAATIVAVFHDNIKNSPRPGFNDIHYYCGRDLTTLHCQIIS